jgi:putative membrane protein
MTHLLYFVAMAAVMLALGSFLPGFRVNGWVPALIGAVVLGIVNAVLRPVLFLLTLPFTILTLGLFLLVINMMCLWVAQALVPGFRVEGFSTLFVASVILAVVSVLWKVMTKERR